MPELTFDVVLSALCDPVDQVTRGSRARTRLARRWRRVHEAVCRNVLGDTIKIDRDGSVVVGKDAVWPKGGRRELVRHPCPIGGVRVGVITWAEARVNPLHALIEVALTPSLPPKQAFVGLLYPVVQRLKELSTLITLIGRGCVTVSSTKREFRRWSAENELKRRRTCGSMCLEVIRIRKQPHVHFPVVLILAYVVAQHRTDPPVVPLDLPVRLAMVHKTVQIRYPRDTTRVVEELRLQLRSVIEQQRVLDAVRKDPCVPERNGDGVRVYAP